MRPAMVERQEVEALLEYVEMRLQSDKVELPPTVSDDTLATLCRAWLAVQDAPHEFTIWQGDDAVASGSAPTRKEVNAEAMIYALQYAQEGPVRVEFFRRVPDYEDSP